MNVSMSNTKNFRRLVLILGLAGFASGADNFFVSPSLSAIAAGFNMPIAAAGGILTAYMIPYGLLQPLYGYFGDRWSKVNMLRIAVFGLAAGSAGSALSAAFPLLCVLRALTGFFAAGIIALAISIIGETVPGDKRHLYIGRFMAMVFAGQGLSSGLGGIVIQNLSWRAAFLFFSGIALVAGFLLFDLPSSITKIKTRKYNLFYQLKLMSSSRMYRTVFVIAFCAGFLILGIYGYMGSFLNEYIYLSYIQSGLVVMFYGFSCMLCGSKIGKLTNIYGEKKMIMAGQIIGLFSTCFLCLSYTLKSWPIALLATILLGFAYISIQSTLAAMAQNTAAESRGLASGMNGIGLFCGGGIGSLAGARLLAIGSYQTIWIIFGIGTLLLILITGKLKFASEIKEL